MACKDCNQHKEHTESAKNAEILLKPRFQSNLGTKGPLEPAGRIMSQSIQKIAAYQLNPEAFPGISMTICQTPDELLSMAPELILINVEESEGRSICAKMRNEGFQVWGLCRQLIGTQLIQHCL